MAIRYTPTPVPQDDNQPLRQWLDQNNRRIEAAQPDELVEGFALLFNGAADVVANDATPTPILNYADSFASAVIAVDPALGTMTLPNKGGLIGISSWITLNQIGAVRNFTVQLMIEVDGVWSLLGAAYIPQTAQDVDVGISASVTRSVDGGEVIRWGLLLDGASPVTFQVLNCSFEIKYLTARG